MGVAGAMLMPSTMSILIVTFPNENERRRAMSVFALASVVGLVGGPLVGGLLIERLQWQAIFWLNIPFVIAGAALALIYVSESRGPARSLDVVGSGLTLVCCTAFLGALILAPSSSLRLWAPIALVGGVTLALSIAWQRTARDPLIPLALFRDPRFVGSCMALFLLQAALAGLLLMFTQYLQLVLGYSPDFSALALLPVVVAMIAVQPIAVGLKSGQEWALQLGLVTIAVSLVGIALMGQAATFPMLVLPLLGFGIGAGLAQPAAMTILTGAIPKEHAGVGSAVGDTILQIGAAFGVAGIGAIHAGLFRRWMEEVAPITHSLGEVLTSAAPDQVVVTAKQVFVDSMGWALGVAAALTLLAAAAATLLIRGTARVELSQPEGHDLQRT